MIFKSDKGMDDFLNLCRMIMIQNVNLLHNYQKIKCFLHQNLRARTGARQKRQNWNFSEKQHFV